MPELPEVETVCRGLRNTILDCTITDIEVKNSSLRKPFPTNIKNKLKNCKINGIDRRGKYGIIKSNLRLVLLFHLGMSGTIKICNAKHYVFRKHDHVIIYLDNGYNLVFNDPRKFGFMDILRESLIVEYESLKLLGPEPLEKNFNYKYFYKKICKSEANIKSIIMNQKIVAGLGNIYSNEALFESGIDPLKKGKLISKKKSRELVLSIKNVLRQSIRKGGSSLKDYSDLTGELGYFQNQFKVYDREKQPCYKCGADVIKVIQNGRSSYLCKKCQK